MDIIKETAEKIREADALLIGASNGLSITKDCIFLPVTRPLRICSEI